MIKWTVYKLDDNDFTILKTIPESVRRMAEDEDKELLKVIGKFRGNMPLEREEFEKLVAAAREIARRLWALREDDCPFCEVPGRKTPVATDWLAGQHSAAGAMLEWSDELRSALNMAKERENPELAEQNLQLQRGAGI